MSTEQAQSADSRRPVRRAVAVVMLTMAGLGMVGCDSGPTMDELGPRFEQDALVIIRYLADSYAESSGRFDAPAEPVWIEAMLNCLKGNPP